MDNIAHHEDWKKNSEMASFVQVKQMLISPSKGH